MTQTDFKKLGLAVIETELEAVNTLKSRIDDNFARACELMLNCEGRIVVTGMGKSGHIGGKIAATLASTGSPARKGMRPLPPAAGRTTSRTDYRCSSSSSIIR